MNRELLIDGTIVPYTLTVNGKVRHLRITIKPGGDIRVTIPRYARPGTLDAFLLDNIDWIRKKWSTLFAQQKQITRSESRTLYEKHKEGARRLVVERIAFFNVIYNFPFGNIAIRNQKTRWGSCSKKGNLNFNYKIALLPQDLADYVIVHELCHLKEFNHGEKFWTLVEKTIPDYKKKRLLLKQEGLTL